jgi:hypothetical protein
MGKKEGGRMEERRKYQQQFALWSRPLILDCLSSVALINLIQIPVQRQFLCPNRICNRGG